MPDALESCGSCWANNAGNVLWTEAFDGTLDFGGTALVAEADGLSSFFVKFDSSGKHLWSKQFKNAWYSGIVTDASGHVVTMGYFGFTGALDFGSGPVASPGGEEIFLAKLAP